MANEIIALERVGGSISYAYLIPIPAEKLVEIGGDGTTGLHPVYSASADAPEFAQAVLTQPEKDALDLGTSALIVQTLEVGDAMTNGELLALAREHYTRVAQEALAAYEVRYAFVGLRFDKT